MSEDLLKTPLHAAHLKLKARMVDFAGWDMPVMYTSILEEARSVRTGIGIFDISHMGRIIVSGQGATALLQAATSNDVAALKFTQAQYSLITNYEGGIVDDIIVYRESDESYLIVINASNAAKDIAWLHSLRQSDDVVITDKSLETAMIAVQGPSAPAAVAKLFGDDSILDTPRFHYVRSEINGHGVTLCRTGYTGEDGFELIVLATDADAIWQSLLDAGAAPCGLGSRDALRIEAGYPLYGHEIDDTTSPVGALLMWAVSMEKGAFTGRDQIAEIRSNGPSRKLMGMVCKDRIQPRQGYTVYIGNEAVGAITSGVFSPTLGHSVAMAYIDSKYAKSGVEVEVAIRDKRAAATLRPKKNLLQP